MACVSFPALSCISCSDMLPASNVRRSSMSPSVEIAAFIPSISFLNLMIPSPNSTSTVPTVTGMFIFALFNACKSSYVLLSCCCIFSNAAGSTVTSIAESSDFNSPALRVNNSEALSILSIFCAICSVVAFAGLKFTSSLVFPSVESAAFTP